MGGKGICNTHFPSHFNLTFKEELFTMPHLIHSPRERMGKFHLVPISSFKIHISTYHSLR